jgi:S1-C subfamily serine protease
MNKADWVAVAIIAVSALNGLRTGLIAGAFSLAGLVGGAYAGAKLAPQLFSGGDSPYTPLVALGGAVVLGVLLRSVAGLAGGTIRKTLFVVPPLRVLDTLGGGVLGAAAGLVLVWVLGAAALHVPGQTELRRQVQASKILSRLNREVPPSRLLDAIARVDPFGAIPGPLADVSPPDLAPPAAAAGAAERSVVRVVGTACGLGVQGSGWIAGSGLVVTNAHVVAGVRDLRVDRHDRRFRKARAVYFDPRNDVAVLRVPGLGGRALQLAQARQGEAVAILGYPENEPLTATPGRIGQTAKLLTDDAYGRGPVARLVTTLRGEIRHGNSGGPAVDGNGRVEGTIYAKRAGGSGGYAVPPEVVREAIVRAGSRTVSTGPCVR